jgi:hypothetical protein
MLASKNNRGQARYVVSMVPVSYHVGTTSHDTVCTHGKWYKRVRVLKATYKDKARLKNKVARRSRRINRNK